MNPGAILIAILMLLAGSGSAAAGWITEAVRTGGDVGSWSSLAIYSGPGLTTDLHVSYYDATNGNLKHAKKVGKIWSFSTVARAGDVGRYNALAIGKRAPNTGEPRIAYLDSTRGKISYATHSADLGWQISILRRQWFAAGGYYPSLVVDSADRYHILHLELSVIRNHLWYLTPSTRGFGWDRTALGVEVQGKSSSLAVAGDDTLHAVYLDFCPPPIPDCSHGGEVATVVHASNTGPSGAWETENILALDGYEGITSSSIAVDAQGAVHIAYVDRSFLTLIYFTNASGQWLAQVVVDGGVFGASMKLDNAGHVHFSYSTGDALKYATNKTGHFVYETVDAGSAIGGRTSIDIDRFGQPHISYYDASAGDLRHAVRTGVAD